MNFLFYIYTIPGATWAYTAMRYGRRADLILKVLPLFLLTTYHFSYDYIACHCVFMFVCVPFVDRENLRWRHVCRFLRCTYARTSHTQEHRMNDKDKGRLASEKVNGKQIERNLGSKCSSSLRLRIYSQCIKTMRPKAPLHVRKYFGLWMGWNYTAGWTSSHARRTHRHNITTLDRRREYISHFTMHKFNLCMYQFIIEFSLLRLCHTLDLSTTHTTYSRGISQVRSLLNANNETVRFAVFSLLLTPLTHFLP